MERLTQNYCGDVLIAAHLEEKYTAEQLIDILAARLAEYEDLGLEPAALEKIIKRPELLNAVETLYRTITANVPNIVQAVIDGIPLAVENALVQVKQETEG